MSLLKASAEVSPLTALKAALREGRVTPSEVAAECASAANANASRNTYLHLDRDEIIRSAANLNPDAPLFGIPVSLKDLFDLTGTKTSAGTKFYAGLNPVATADSGVAARLKQAGCLITGKTHLHPLAYGVTGENLDFGDCLQPRDSGLLTGGSSSGAAASVQEGSALVAIGTDTGGSVRIPAALCGLVGYRASHALKLAWPELWKGGMHLSQTFDTIGLLLRDLRDLSELARTLFRLPETPVPARPRIGCVPLDFVADANAEVREAYAAWKATLQANGATLVEFSTASWERSGEIYSGIQSNEAATIHRRYFDKLLPTLDPAIAARLRSGAALTDPDLESLASRHAHFRAALASQLAQFDFLMLPSAPINRLVAGEDQLKARMSILRYTTPFSLGGLPVVTLPGEAIGAPLGTGVQLAAAQMEDFGLVEFCSRLRLAQ